MLAIKLNKSEKICLKMKNWTTGQNINTTTHKEYVSLIRKNGARFGRHRSHPDSSQSILFSVSFNCITRMGIFDMFSSLIRVDRMA